MSAAKGSNLVNVWKWYINKHLGKSVARKYVSVMADIAAVDCGIKPGYLYDVGEPNPNKLANLLQDLKSAELINSFCNVVQVGLDCVIVNVDCVRAMDISVDHLQGRLVDVSNTRSSPGLCEDNTAAQQLSETMRNIKDDLDSRIIHIYDLVNPLCNVSSLFGLLLGYPVLYWYDNSEDHHGNCLSMETIKCVKMSVKFNQGKLPNCGTLEEIDVQHYLYSFSYPASLFSYFRTSVDDWFVVIQGKLDRSPAFYDPEIIQEDKVFETLSL